MRSWVQQNTNHLSAARIELRQSLRLQTREAFDFSRGRLHFQRLTELSCREKQSRTALLTEGLRQGFVNYERRILRLSSEEFEACVRVMTTPETDPVVLARRQKLRTMKPVWED